MSETTTQKTQPITVQPDDFEKMVGYLLEQPAKFAIPLLNYFQQEQARAQQTAPMPPVAVDAEPIASKPQKRK